MKMQDLLELLAGRASHRKYLSDPIPTDDILTMAEAARHAPSGHNLQPWKLLAVIDKALIADIADASTREYKALVARLPEDVRERQGRFEFFVGHFREAPLVFAVLSKKSEIDSDGYERLYGVRFPRPKCFDLDCLGVGAFIQNLLLAAEALGYGTCWVAAPVMYAQEKVEQLLSVREPWHVVSLVSVTKPVRERKGAPKKDLGEILTIVS